jgi:hypothetical protein
MGDWAPLARCPRSPLFRIGAEAFQAPARTVWRGWSGTGAAPCHVGLGDDIVLQGYSEANAGVLAQVREGQAGEAWADRPSIVEDKEVER